MSTEAVRSNPEQVMSGVEACEQMATLFQDCALLLLEQGVVREPQGRVWELYWPTGEYFRDSEMPQFPRDEGSQRYRDDYESRRTHGYLESASMRLDTQDQRLKSAQLSFALPREGDDPCRDHLIWRVQMPKDRHHNGQPRMIIDIYESPGNLLAEKIKELEVRHGRYDDDGKNTGFDAEAYNADIQGEYSELYNNIYRETNDLGIPVLTRAHRRHVLGRDGFIGSGQQQELVNLAGVLTMAVDAGIQWKQAFRNDPEEFHEAA